MYKVPSTKDKIEGCVCHNNGVISQFGSYVFRNQRNGTTIDRDVIGHEGAVILNMWVKDKGGWCDLRTLER